MIPTNQKLHKVLAQSGLGSRRDMETLIERGEVRVNGVVATVGTRISSEDMVAVEGRRVRLNFSEEAPRIMLYHKPEGEIVSRDDPEGRPSVFDALPRVKGAKWISIGRLDFNSSGLLIFTTSGDLANRLTHPSFEVEREYAVRVVGELTEQQLKESCQEIMLDDGPAHFERIRDNGGEGTNHWYQVVLKEGRNREVRRMFEALHLMVGRLMRVRFGMIDLPPRLKRGQFLELEPTAVNQVLKWAEMEPMHTPQRRPTRDGRANTPGSVRKSSTVRKAPTTREGAARAEARNAARADARGSRGDARSTARGSARDAPTATKTQGRTAAPTRKTRGTAEAPTRVRTAGRVQSKTSAPASRAPSTRATPQRRSSRRTTKT